MASAARYASGIWDKVPFDVGGSAESAEDVPMAWSGSDDGAESLGEGRRPGSSDQEEP